MSRIVNLEEFKDFSYMDRWRFVRLSPYEKGVVREYAYRYQINRKRLENTVRDTIARAYPRKIKPFKYAVLSAVESSLGLRATLASALRNGEEEEEIRRDLRYVRGILKRR